MCDFFLLLTLSGSLLADPLLPDAHPEPTISGADEMSEAEEPCPRDVRLRMEDLAGGARLHHYGICHTYRARSYTARYTDSATGVENLISVRVDGGMVHVEPFLVTAVVPATGFPATGFPATGDSTGTGEKENQGSPLAIPDLSSMQPNYRHGMRPVMIANF